MVWPKSQCLVKLVLFVSCNIESTSTSLDFPLWYGPNLEPPKFKWAESMGGAITLIRLLGLLWCTSCCWKEYCVFTGKDWCVGPKWNELLLEFEEEEDEIVQSKKNNGQKTSFVGFVKLPAVKVQAGFQEEEEESPIRQRLGSVKRRPVGFAASNRSLSSVSSIKQSAA